MIGQTATCDKPTTGGASFENELRTRIQGLSYLPSSAAVAMKFIELGRDPESGPNEYAKVISSDASLATKLLAMVNSSWFGVRHRVTKIPMAVSLLGLCNVRALALSYCMTGLHHELGLDRDDSLTYWEAGLCKAVAARCYVQALDEAFADVAFAAGIFQDFALTVMHAVDGGETLKGLSDPATPTSRKLEAEKSRFGMDHCEAGRLLAQKLELPEIYVDTVAFHHDAATLRQFIDNSALAEGIYVASLMPHVRTCWHHEDVEAAKAAVEANGRIPGGWEGFLGEVQKELNELFAYFQDGRVPEMQLQQMMAAATREMADITSSLVMHVNETMAAAAAQGKLVDAVLREKEQLKEKALRDPLTRAYNRDGFQARAGEVLERARRYRGTLALAFLDVDEFKKLNDTHGHPFGDHVLTEAAARMEAAAEPGGVVGRLGGDEFAVLFADLSREQAQNKMIELSAAAKQSAFRRGNVAVPLTWTVGMVYVASADANLDLDMLIRHADEVMYEAKRSGRGSAVFRAV